jgi:hypothetical protein
VEGEYSDAFLERYPEVAAILHGDKARDALSR